MPAWTITLPFADVDMQRKAEWVAMMMSASESTATRLKVTPEAIVAQAALESGWGAATVGRFGLFGIKADASWKGERALCRTRESINGEYITIDDWFRDYPSAEACIEDHFDFLDQNQRYRDAGVFDGKGDFAYFEALKRAGYATDPSYVDSLMAVEGTVRNRFLSIMKPTDIASTDISPSASPAAPAHRILIVGCTGADVADLQRRLNIDVDSSFGPKTLAAVQIWQKKHNLKADGVVGPDTWATLDA